MKRLAILLVALPLICNGQHTSVLPDLMATGSVANELAGEKRISDFVNQLEIKKPDSETAFLKRVFHQTQRTFLAQYNPYSEFSELFTSGNYDCLTATSLFATVLERLNFSYRIVETNYHIFLLVKTSKGEVLLETTDRYAGFVRNENDIRQRIFAYRNPETPSTTENQQVYRYHFDLYHELSPSQLPGLLYYNQAVKAYNEDRLEKCGELLAKAKAVYDTPRISEFSSVFLQSVLGSKLDSQTKQRILERFRNLTSQPAVLASR